MRWPFSRREPETKGYVGPITIGDNPGLVPGYSFIPVLESSSGAWQRNIVVESMRNVLTFSAVFACVSLISDDIAKLRIKLTRNRGGIWEEVTDSPLLKVLRKPNRYQTRIQFLSQWIASKLLYGNTYIVKRYDNRPMVSELYVLDPRRTKAYVGGDGQVYYSVGEDDLTQVDAATAAGLVDSDDIIHDRMITLWHPLCGVSPIYACGATATQGIRIQANSAQFFENMSRPSGVLAAPGPISPENIANLKAQFEQNFGRGNLGRLMVTGEGMKYEPMTIPASDAQLIEQLRWTVEDVARCFVPDTEIITRTGIKQIKDVAVGDMVLTHKGRWKRVEQTIRSQYVGKVLKIRAKGLKAITATANHPFYVQSAKPNRSHLIEPVGEAEWVLAADMVPAKRGENGARSRRAFHNLIMPRLCVDAQQTIDMSQWAPAGSVIEGGKIKASTNHRATSIKRFVKADYALGWICGLYAGDGSKGDHQVCFYLGERETDITDILVQRLSSVFDVDSTTKIARSVARTTISNRVLHGFFAQFGVGPENKAFPDWCMDQCDEFRAGLADGLVDSDGCVNGPRTIVKIASQAMAWQLRLILWARGVNTSFMEQEERIAQINGWSGVCQKLYSVQWMTDGQQRGSMGVKDDLVYFSLDDCDADVYSGDVYNLEVEEDHSYTTVGGVAHNCFHVPLHKIQNGSNPTFTNIGAFNQDYYSQTLQKHIEDIELLLDEGLGLASDMGTELDLEGLLRMDPKTQAETSEIEMRSGTLSPNEGRFIRNRPPVEGGDSPMVQQQQFSLAAIRKRDAKEDPFATAKPPAEKPPTPEPDDSESEKQFAVFMHDLTKGLQHV